MAKSRGLSEQLEPASANNDTLGVNPDSLIYGIRWPANRLTSSQMRTLRQISRDVRLPITQLLKDAVDVYLAVLQREMQAMMVAERTANGELGEVDATNNEESAFSSESSEYARATGAPNENSPTGRMPLSGCHEDRRIVAEFGNGLETSHLAGIDLSSGPKTQLGFIFSED